jgi:hypothetical protein
MIPATRSRRILQGGCGKVTGSCREIPEIAGTWKPFSDQELSGFFLVDSCQLPVLSGKNWSKITGKKFLTGILLPLNRQNYPELAVSRPDCSTWAV